MGYVNDQSELGPQRDLRERKMHQAAGEQNRDYRISALENLYQRNPGRAPGGSGSTGLSSWDSGGYGRMLNEQQEYGNLIQERAGKGPMDVQFGGYPEAFSSTPYQQTYDPRFQRSALTGQGFDPKRRNMAINGLMGAK